MDGSQSSAGLAALQACYDDLAKAMAFVSALMVDLMNNDPAVAQATIDAITKTGYALPLLGVTNGTAAQPPQVGEYVQFSATLDYTSTTVREQLSLGVLEPGDWDCWLWATFTATINGAIVSLNPLPAGFAANPAMSFYSGVVPSNVILSSMTVAALTAGQSLIAADTQVAATSGQFGVMTVYFAARRRR